jgi:hypothetical protein
VVAVLELPITWPVVPVSAVHRTPIVALNYDAGETIGWPAFVREIAAAYRSLPPAQRPDTTILTVGVNDDEQGAPVWICQRLTSTWQAIWPGQKHFG